MSRQNIPYLIRSPQFADMKHGVFFVYTARGAIVDEEALISGFKSGKLSTLSLEVFENEPNPNDYF